MFLFACLSIFLLVTYCLFVWLFDFVFLLVWTVLLLLVCLYHWLICFDCSLSINWSEWLAICFLMKTLGIASGSSFSMKKRTVLKTLPVKGKGEEKGFSTSTISLPPFLSQRVPLLPREFLPSLPFPESKTVSRLYKGMSWPK